MNEWLMLPLLLLFVVVDDDDADADDDDGDDGDDGDVEAPQRPGPGEQWRPTSEWIKEWKSRLPLQTLMRMLQVALL